jgi:hypothetical protein
MPFQLKASAPHEAGKYLFLKDGQVVTLTLLEDLGKQPAVGTYAKNDKGESNYWEVFRVTVEGRELLLAGNWRLRKVLTDVLREQPLEHPKIKITTTMGLEKIRGVSKAVKGYQIEVLGEGAEEAPF